VASTGQDLELRAQEFGVKNLHPTLAENFKANNQQWAQEIQSLYDINFVNLIREANSEVIVCDTDGLTEAQVSTQILERIRLFDTNSI
jgi:hypothetical protein